MIVKSDVPNKQIKPSEQDIPGAFLQFSDDINKNSVTPLKRFLKCV